MEVLRVLIAEDQEIVRIGLRLVLENDPVISIVAEASTGELAVKFSQDHSPDLVLMDLGLPVMDGIDATRAIKSANPDTRVIILTSHDSESDVFAALSADADGYCLKSASKEHLLSAMKSVMDGGKWVDPGIAGFIVKALISTSSSVQMKALQKESGSEHSRKPLLSSRELEVLNLVVEGLSNQQMAERLFVSVETVKSHMRHLMEKLQVADRTQAAVKGLKEKLVIID